MSAELKLTEILSRVKKMTRVEQMTLLQKITLLVSKPDSPTVSVKLSDISGLGSSLWADINIDEYVDGERQW